MNSKADPSTTAQPGGIYRHFKGAEFTVGHIAIHTETGEALVIYSGEDGVAWARPRSMFEDGRFRRMR